MLKLKLQYFGHLIQKANLLKRPWCWERLKAGREGDDRGWDGWMASLTQWTWVWVNFGNWWWTGRPGMLQSMGSHAWATELNFLSPQNAPKNPGYHCCLYTISFLDVRAFVYRAVWRDGTLSSSFYINIDPNMEKDLFFSVCPARFWNSVILAVLTFGLS